MIVIGVTGTIGSGKSTVCRILAELGCFTIDADKVAHSTYRRGTRVWKAIVDHFGPEVQRPDGGIDRRALGQVVFHDSAARSWLNGVVHPATRESIERQLRRLEERGRRCAAVEATLLLEADWASLVDRVWVVVAPEDKVFERLERDRNQSPSATRARLSSQMPAQQQAAHADAVIENDGDIEALRAHVTRLYRALPDS
ncbi:MAG: dephospho-CoA kinase [Chloroflexota bacterium]